jgi:carboxylesterase type B
MQDAWIAFARHGKPEHDGFEQDARRWPAYDEARRATMWLAPTCRVEPAPLDVERRFWQERLA